MDKPAFLNCCRAKGGFVNYRLVKQIIVAILGASVLLIGLALVILPGPAFIVIPLGLGILATEFVWAKHWLDKVKGMLGKSKPQNGLDAKSGRDAIGEDANRDRLTPSS